MDTVLECSGCRTLQSIVQIDPDEHGGPPALWCAACLNQRLLAPIILGIAQQKAQDRKQAESLRNFIEGWKEDPLLSMLELGTYVLAKHLQK